MPDVSRSDSQRSDTSLRPRVSFNRDVHVKRIVPRETTTRPIGAQSSDGDGHLISSTVRKERIKKSKKELAQEAAQVLKQADKLNCFTNLDRDKKFFTLPTRKKEKKINYPTASLDRRSNNKKSGVEVKLKRSVSDTSSKLLNGHYQNKKQLSPIIENTQREDYFQPNNGNPHQPIDSSVTQQLKKYIDEVDRQIDEDNKKRKNSNNNVDVVVIDIDSAEKISPPSKLKKRIKAAIGRDAAPPKTQIVEAAKRNLKREQVTMIHSSQQPPDKPPLTKGRTVNKMVKRLSRDTYSPPPRPKVTVTPTPAMQHNNNQPFSYTRGLSPDKLDGRSPPPPPIIYAQVVTGPQNSKQTIHTVYQHSDSDEGLGNEQDSLLAMRKARSEKVLTHFGDEESPIRPKYRVLGSSFECLDESVFGARGRGDGMDDMRRRDSLSEDVVDQIEANRYDLSARRDLLESRITKRINGEVQQQHGNNDGFKRSDSSSPPYKSSAITSHRNKIINVYKSTPDIVNMKNEWNHHHGSKQTYHNSLRRDDEGARHQRTTMGEKDRFGDSGIENDFRRDSKDYPYRKTTKYYNDSEDEGFASSLLIASERQHTEENINLHHRKRNEYDDSDRAYSAEDNDPYRHLERLDYKMVPRERSIDDGSHFDPRLDKEFRNVSTATLKKSNEKKPPKPEKRTSGLEKVKRLFTREKKKDKVEMVREGSLRARYTEYKGGSRGNLVEAVNKSEETFTENNRYAGRRRLSTPSPSPTRDLEAKRKSKDNLQTSWFKSLDRLSRKKNKKDVAKVEMPPSSLSSSHHHAKRGNEKSLRFFGDTDQDSSDNNSSARHSSKLRHRNRSQSSRELHNITEEKSNARNYHHKSMTNIASNGNIKGGSNSRPSAARSSLKPPMSPAPTTLNRRSESTTKLNRAANKNRKYDISSVESSTEGDSSQQSQRSVVYLHAATVGDIPGPVHLKYTTKRASSRDELNEVMSTPGRIQPQIKTLSRSFSVLAPWKPRHAHETTNIDYSQQPRTMKTLKRSGNNGSSKENLSKTTATTTGTSTLYKKKNRMPRENSRYNSKDSRVADDKKAKSMSVESLRSNGRSDRGGSHDRKRADISRSISMPKDPEKSAGWFGKMHNNNNNVKNKTHHRSDYITQRL